MRPQRQLIFLLGPVLLVLGFWSHVTADHQPASRLAPSLEPMLTPPVHSESRLNLRRDAIVRAVQRIKGAVVNIHSERTLRGNGSLDQFALSPSQNRINGMGTGIIIDPRGYIVTNQHVVEDVNVIRVRLNDGTSTVASVVSRSTDVDIALLKIDTNRPLQTMPLGTAQDLMVGETVIAIGNAYGYEHTVSRGIVSAVKRDVRLNKEIEYRSLIQTDASINPGNSGGPLVNIHGDLVGVNVAIRAGAQGIGFAIPVDTMIQMVSQMLRTQRVAQVADGMDYRDNIQLSEDGAVRNVLVENVEAHGAAAEAGLRRGDVLLCIDQVPILCSFDVDRALLGHKAGDTVAVSYRREGQTQSTSVVLGKSAGQRANPNELVWQKLGLQLTPVNRDSVVSINSQLNGGLQVTAVLANSAAARAGIRQGDILVGLHQWETLSIDNVAFVLLHPDLASFNPLSFYIIRSGQVRRGWIQQVD